MTNVFLKTFSKLRAGLADLRKDEAGNFSIVAAVCMVVIIGFIALTLDASNSYSARSKLQDTADNISLMAARGDFKSQKEMREAAQSHLEAMFPAAQYQNVKLSQVKRVGDMVTVEVSNKTETLFGNILGFDSIDVAARSTATIERRNIDIALVLDTTGSMRGQKIQSLKSAANNLVNRLDKNQNDNIRMSVVPFAQYVNVGVENARKPWLNAPRKWNGCVGSRSGNLNVRAGFSGAAFPGLADVSCPVAIQPLTKKLSNVKSKIASLDARGWTYMPAGLAWGWRSLETQVPMAHGNPNGSVDKILILMTDGRNTKSNSGLYHNGTSQADADRTTADLCDAVKGSNIQIYSIAYEIKEAATKNLLRNCASKNVNYFDAANASQLNEAFKAIGENLEQLRISS